MQAKKLKFELERRKKESAIMSILQKAHENDQADHIVLANYE